MSICLGMIVKDEVSDIERILKDYRQYFDEIQITITSPDKRKEIEEICDKYKANYTYFEWVEDFAAARNFNKELCKSDWVFVIDTDDVILYPEKIREVAERAKSEHFNVVYGYYHYGVDQDGNCCAAHWKERLIKNSKNLRWNKKIHENIVPLSMVGHNFDLDERLEVKHNCTYEDSLKSNERNIKFLLEEYKQDGEKTDPRTIAYLGRVFFGLGDFKRARYFLEKHIELSGWDEDRFQS